MIETFISEVFIVSDLMNEIFVFIAFKTLVFMVEMFAVFTSNKEMFIESVFKMDIFPIDALR